MDTTAALGVSLSTTNMAVLLRNTANHRILPRKVAAILPSKAATLHNNMAATLHNIAATHRHSKAATHHRSKVVTLLNNTSLHIPILLHQAATTQEHIQTNKILKPHTSNSTMNAASPSALMASVVLALHWQVAVLAHSWPTKLAVDS